MSSNLQGSSKQLFEEDINNMQDQAKPLKLDSSHVCILHKKPLPCEDCYSGTMEERIDVYGRELWKRIGIIPF